MVEIPLSNYCASIRSLRDRLSKSCWSRARWKLLLQFCIGDCDCALVHSVTCSSSSSGAEAARALPVSGSLKCTESLPAPSKALQLATIALLPNLHRANLPISRQTNQFTRGKEKTLSLCVCLHSSQCTQSALTCSTDFCSPSFDWTWAN